MSAPSTGSLSAYWNSRLDPLDWKRRRAVSSPRRWSVAHDTFLSPDTAEALDWLGDLRGRDVLELGCGQGYGSAHLARAGARVVGLDISDRRCAMARRSLDADPPGTAAFCAADAQALPFGDRTFDAVFSRDVLMYASPRRVAAECLRVLAPGGRVVFVESLEGPAALRVFRRMTSPRDYRDFTRHLGFDELQRLGPPLELRAARAWHVLALGAFLALFLGRSPALYRLALRALVPLDARLLAAWPVLERVAWRGVAVYRRPLDA